jgi:hypothetical protein
MDPRKGATGADEKSDTTGAHRFAANAPRMSRAELERLLRVRKLRAASKGKLSGPASQSIPPPSVRDFASVAPLLVNAIEDEAPTLMRNRSHLSIRSKNISPRKSEGTATVGRSTLSQGRGTTNATRARAVPPPIPPTVKRRVTVDALRARLQNSPRRFAVEVAAHGSDKPTAQLPVKPSSPADTRVWPALHRARQAAPPPPVHAAPEKERTGLRDELAVVASISTYPREQLPVEARPHVATTLIDPPEIRTAKSRVWIRITLWSAALLVLVQAVRFLVAIPAVVPIKELAPVAGTEVRNDPAGVQVGAQRSGATPAAMATPAATAAPAAIVALNPVVPPAPADRAIQRVRIDDKSSPRRTIVSSRSHRPATLTSVNSKASTLRINHRPRSQGFVNRNLVGNTAQTDLGLGARPQPTKLSNESLAVLKILKVNFQGTLTPLGFWRYGGETASRL